MCVCLILDSFWMSSIIIFIRSAWLGLACFRSSVLLFLSVCSLIRFHLHSICISAGLLLCPSRDYVRFMSLTLTSIAKWLVSTPNLVYTATIPFFLDRATKFKNLTKWSHFLILGYTFHIRTSQHFPLWAREFYQRKIHQIKKRRRSIILRLIVKRFSLNITHLTIKSEWKVTVNVRKWSWFGAIICASIKNTVVINDAYRSINRFRNYNISLRENSSNATHFRNQLTDSQCVELK